MTEHRLPAGDQESPNDTAVRWFVRSLDGLTPSEDAELASWHDADTDNSAAFARVGKAWDLSAAASTHPEVRAMRRRALMRRRERLSWRAAAAAVLVASVAALPLALRLAPAPTEQIATPQSRLLQTGVGERATVTLEDGSIVTLNTSTRLRLMFGPVRRSVALLEGQALFQVAKDKTRPFTVRAGAHDVVATGTQFEVRVDAPRALRVALLEGSVDVREDGRGHGKGAQPRHVVKLKSGEQLIATPDGIMNVTVADIESLTSWREGRVQFDDTPLADAVKEMNRYSLIPVVIADPTLESIHVSGTFRTGRSARFVSALTQIFPIRAHRAPEAIVLTRSS